MYADDLLLVSISIFDMQKMLEICEKEFAKIDVRQRNKIIVYKNWFKINAVVTSVSINKEQINWNTELKYLGMTMLAGKKFALQLSSSQG